MVELYVFFVSEDFISQSATKDGDFDRVERMRMCEELWNKCNKKIQVKFPLQLVIYINCNQY